MRVENENEMRVFLESLNFEIKMRVSQKSASNKTESNVGGSESAVDAPDDMDVDALNGVVPLLADDDNEVFNGQGPMDTEGGGVESAAANNNETPAESAATAGQGGVPPAADPNPQQVPQLPPAVPDAVPGWESPKRSNQGEDGGVACTHPGCKARLKNRRTMYTHRRNQHGGADGGKYVVRCDTCHAKVQRKNLAAHKMFFNPGESI